MRAQLCLGLFLVFSGGACSGDPDVAAAPVPLRIFPMTPTPNCDGTFDWSALVELNGIRCTEYVLRSA